MQNQRYVKIAIGAQSVVNVSMSLIVTTKTRKGIRSMEIRYRELTFVVSQKGEDLCVLEVIIDSDSWMAINITNKLTGDKYSAWAGDPKQYPMPLNKSIAFKVMKVILVMMGAGFIESYRLFSELVSWLKGVRVIFRDKANWPCCQETLDFRVSGNESRIKEIINDVLKKYPLEQKEKR